MQNWLCTHKCFWESLVEEGQIITVDDIEEIPFSVRPFFKDMAEISKVEPVNEANEIEKLQMELEAMGKGFDRRWGKSKLMNTLQLARRDST
ncbi:MAG: hypothetical protein Q8J68_14790 [Methanolobus sp.]|uniref:hypothetical protein n=1 Tax=Methanolobus sp. TaxID=1874737 RepID=UPI002730C843|nr:hypothetical protein [Methanolobus sp.]MDP2218542.1 hypothetical protein [Methanolobus sp.]